jgi:hypothetical protein
MTKHDTYWDQEYEDPDELANLPPDQVVTAAQLTMAPGERLRDKAKQLGCTTVTLRMYHLEWRGSGFSPDFRVRRLTHGNWLKNRWNERDWVAALREVVAHKQHRDQADICLELGIVAGRAQQWSLKCPAFEKLLWATPPSKYFWRDRMRWVSHGTIERYRALKAEKIASGMDAVTAAHAAADTAINEVKYRAQQRRRVERDQLLGVTMHEEMTKRWRRGGRLWDAHSRRLGKRLLKLTRYAAMERGLKEAGYKEKEIEAKIEKLKTAFEQSGEHGQAHWQKLRKGILRKKAHREAKVRADQAEARAIEKLPGVRKSKFVKQIEVR